MNNINIDTEKLTEQIAKLKTVTKNFEQIFTRVKNDTNLLKEYWDSATSESVFESFEEFYNAVENVKQTFQKDIEFLEKTVNGSYIENNEGTNKLIDENFA